MELANARSQGSDTTVLAQQLNDVQSTLSTLGQIVVSGEDVPAQAKQAIAKQVNQSRQNKAQMEQVNQYRSSMGNMLAEADIGWDDPVLADVRTVWDNGQMQDAHARLQSAVIQKLRASKEASIETDEQFSVRVKEAVAKAGVLKQDLGEGSAPANGSGELTAARLVDDLSNPKLTTRERADIHKKNMDAFFKQGVA